MPNTINTCPKCGAPPKSQAIHKNAAWRVSHYCTDFALAREASTKASAEALWNESTESALNESNQERWF